MHSVDLLVFSYTPTSAFAFGSRDLRVTASQAIIFPDLGDLEEPEDVGDHDGDAGEGSADDACDGR